MKTDRILVLLIFFLTVSTVVSYRVITKLKKDPTVKEAETAYFAEKYDLKRRNLEKRDRLFFWSVVGVVSSACCSGLIIAAGWHRAHVKRAKVHLYKIGTAEIWVSEGDLSMAWQLCTGLVNAEALEKTNAGMQKAFELYTTIADLQNVQLKALVNGHANRPALPAPTQEQPALVSSAVPTVTELMQQGTIAADRPLVFGFSQGQAITGTWKDIYSNATGGQSGSGKTNTLRSIITQSVLQRVFFWIIDFHWPHDESLLATIGPLRQTPFVTYADKPIDVRPILEEVNDTIDRRKNKQESCEQVKVLAIDEVLRIVKNCSYTEEVIERIGTEGRKLNVYGLFSAQSWTADKISTTARDNLTSIFAHNMKRTKAYSLLQDSEQAKTVHKLRKGQMLFCPTNGQENVLDVPLCSSEDVKLVANMVNSYTVNFPNNSQNYSEPIHSDSHRKTGEFTDSQLIDFVKKHYQTDKDFCEKHGIHKGQFSTYTRKGRLSESMRAAVLQDINRPQLSVLDGGKK